MLTRRRVGRFVVGSAVALAVLAGITGVGVLTSMAETFPAAPPAQPPGEDARLRPPQPPSGDRLTVAVVLGATGSVAADVLIPYEVFARAPQFSVYTVARTRDPVTLSGAVHVVPDRTFDDDNEPPDVVVVPAVADPAGEDEAPLRAWVGEQAKSGSHILGICAGSEVLAASGVLDGRRATSHWARIGSLARSYPDVNWVRGHRYVQAGTVTTTGGITSGAAGALRVLEQLAGPEEAARVGVDLGYPGWSLDGDTRIADHHFDVGDVPYGLNAAFPWSRPTIALALQDGVGEVEVAAAAEVYSGGSFAARTLAVSPDGIVTTRHGLVLATHVADERLSAVDRVIAPGADAFADLEPSLAAWAAAQKLPVEVPEAGSGDRFPFDPYLRDLARTTDRATSLATAQYLEYPTSHLDLHGQVWPWRSTLLLVAAVLVSIGAGWAAAAAPRFLTSRPARPSPKRCDDPAPPPVPAVVT